jgi:phage terminase large subunit
MYIRIPNIDPYPHQARMFKAMVEDKNVCAVIHRRAGKDIFSLQAWLLRGLKRVGTHVYLFPLHKQARSVIWQGLDFDGKPFMDAIPSVLIAKKNEARMEIDLFNGSKLILAGSNNYNGLMGSNPVTIIYSEFSLHNPLARQYLNPIIVQNKGKEILQFTPRGMNHGYEVYNQVKDLPDYHLEHLSVEQTYKNDGITHIITKEDIKRAKELGMSEELIRQEFYVDFEVGNLGAYYTREMGDMVREGRVSIVPPDPRLKLHSIWDLGGTDATAGVLFQVVGKYIHILYLLHDTGKGLKHYLDEAEKVRISFGCQWGYHFGPHDIDQKHQGWEHAESRLMIARKNGWYFQMVPKVSFEDGIEAVRYLFPRLRIHKVNCDLLLRALREYQRFYNEKLARYDSKPLDNWAIHIADAVRYLSVTYKRLYDIPSSPHAYVTTM